MKFLLFGTGEYYNRYKVWFANEEIIALVDNARTKQGGYIDNIKVIAPEDICKYEFDAIIIMSFYIREIKTQLIKLGIKKDQIYHFYDLHKLIYETSKRKKIHVYGNLPKKNDRVKKILLLNQDLTLGGPALALYHAARLLIKSGNQVVYGSMIDGPLKELLIREDIPVVVDENLLVSTMLESNWVKEYSLIICNTINFHIFLSERNTDIPIIWWLHDSLFFYDGVNKEAMNSISKENMKVWAVGPVAENAIKTYRPDFEVEDLLYGVEDTGNHKCLERCANKVRFTVIGYIESRKGQDILLQSIKMLDLNLRKKSEFYFVGQNTSAMAEEVIEAAKGISEMVITGPVGREEIDRVLNKTDVLVCPSREDPMPTVAAEAMMHGVPCLISDAAGTVKYIRDGIDGMVFKCGDTEQLKDLLEGCITGELDLKEMGNNARKVFEDYFSMKAFGGRFRELIEKVDF